MPDVIVFNVNPKWRTVVEPQKYFEPTLTQ